MNFVARVTACSPYDHLIAELIPLDEIREPEVASRRVESLIARP